MFMNGKNGYFIRCTFMNALNADYSPDFFISAVSFVTEKVPLTRLQTDKHTIIYSARLSFHSREHTQSNSFENIVRVALFNKTLSMCFNSHLYPPSILSD